MYEGFERWDCVRRKMKEVEDADPDELSGDFDLLLDEQRESAEYETQE